MCSESMSFTYAPAVGCLKRGYDEEYDSGDDAMTERVIILGKRLRKDPDEHQVQPINQAVNRVSEEVVPRPVSMLCIGRGFSTIDEIGQFLQHELPQSLPKLQRIALVAQSLGSIHLAINGAGFDFQGFGVYHFDGEGEQVHVGHNGKSHVSVSIVYNRLVYTAFSDVSKFL